MMYLRETNQKHESLIIRKTENQIKSQYMGRNLQINPETIGIQTKIRINHLFLSKRHSNLALKGFTSVQLEMKDFSRQTLKDRRAWCEVFQTLKGNCCAP